MQHQLVKCSLLILLCSSGVPASAEKDANVKQKLSMAPVTNFLPPAPGRTRLSQSNVRTGQASRLKKLARSSYPQNHLQKGFYFKQKGQINEALLEFILASEENPRDVRAFYEQAQIFKQTGKTKLAKSALEQALSVSPGDTQARSFLVALHFESGNLLGAAAEVGKMLTLNQAAPQKAKAVQTEHQSLSTLPPTAPGTSSSIFKTANSAEPDPTSAWLHQAAGISEPPKAVAANSNLNDVLSSVAVYLRT